MKLPFSQRSALIGVALAAAGLACGLARAEPAQAEFPTVVVRYSDLNLNEPNGARALYRRIKIAARHACDATNIENLAMFMRYQKCYSTAVTNAVATVQSNRVTALHHAEFQRVDRF